MFARRRNFYFLLLFISTLLILTACVRPLTPEEDNATTESAQAEDVDTVDSTVEETDETEEDQETSPPAGEPVDSTDEQETDAGEDLPDSTDPNVGGGTPDTPEEDADTEEPDEAAEESVDEPVDSAESTDDDVAEETDTEEVEEGESAEESSDQGEGTVDETVDDSTDDGVSVEVEVTEDEVAVEVEVEGSEGTDADVTVDVETEIESETGESVPSTGDAADSTVIEGEGQGAAVEVPQTGEAFSPPPPPMPGTHIVAPGENLYRIGLKYGLSWIALARYNHIPNPHRIYVGQALSIPPNAGMFLNGASPPQESPVPGAPVIPPSSSAGEGATDPNITGGETGTGGANAGSAPPATGESAAPAESGTTTQTETTYTVKFGDNLYRIGRSFGVSWIEIAEANGIMNPNQITAGQVLKIPTSAPGPTPEFTHEVQSGETLYQISLQYGVHWIAIAAANNLIMPHQLFPGQILIIPGG